MSPVALSSARSRGTRGAAVGPARRPGLFPTDLLLRQALEARQDRRTRWARLSEVSQLEEKAGLTLGSARGVRALWAEAGRDGVWPRAARRPARCSAGGPATAPAGRAGSTPRRLREVA